MKDRRVKVRETQESSEDRGETEGRRIRHNIQTEESSYVHAYLYTLWTSHKAMQNNHN